MGPVKRQVSDQSLQLGVLFLKLLQPPDLWHTHPDELLLPAVERRLRNAHLPADLLHRSAALRLPQREGNLLVREPLALHGIWSAPRFTGHAGYWA